jgi:hypothetical protein
MIVFVSYLANGEQDIKKIYKNLFYSFYCQTYIFFKILDIISFTLVYIECLY